MLLRDLLFHARNRFHYGIAMCPTVESAAMLRSVMPAGCVFDRFVAHKVEQLIAMAQSCVLKGKRKSFLLILDDCMYDKTICRQPFFRNLFYNGRHYFLSVFIICQYIIDVSPDLRAQIDYVIACREPIMSNKLKLHKMFSGVIGSFEDFCRILERCTQIYECLCLDNTASSNHIQECVFWYKGAVDVPGFRLCAPVFYKLCERYARGDSSSQLLEPPQDQEDGSGPTRGRRSRGVTVVKEEQG